MDELTVSEQFIAYFLDDLKIKYNPQVKIEDLKNDTKSYRIADFYLPKYKVYLEYLGQWNNTKEDRDRYKEKMRVYSRNNIPCIYIYSDNLGIMDYIFHIRLEKELKKFKLDKQLFRYRLSNLYDDKKANFGWLIFVIIALIFIQFDKEAGLYWHFFILLGLIAGFQVFNILRGYYENFYD